MDIAKIARSLSPTQRHCILRFSEAEEWGGTGYGMARTWPDIVYGRKGAQYRTIKKLIGLGLADIDERGSYRLTSLGLSVQLHVRALDPRP